MNDAEERPTPAEMAKALDGMDRDLPTWEANFLDSILKRLGRGGTLTQLQTSKLVEIWRKYFDPDEYESTVEEEDAELDM